MTIVPDGGVIEWQIEPGDTYERALLAHGIVPDTVLIFFRGTSLPEDKPIEEDAVDIILTCSRG
ncbi:MAG: thiamine S protein [Methanomicrobiales archaeon]|nr:thiamine S protein [Methanomicrobiales archaeon]